MDVVHSSGGRLEVQAKVELTCPPPSSRQLLFSINSMLAWLMRTDIAIRQIEKLAFDWIKMDCTGGKCYGLLAVSPTQPKPIDRASSQAPR